MILWKRRARIQAGKVRDATGFAKECCALAEKITGTPVRVYVQVGGNVGNICWVSETKDLAAFEQNTAKLSTDPNWQKLVASGPSLLVQGMTEDEIWRAL